MAMDAVLPHVCSKSCACKRYILLDAATTKDLLMVSPKVVAHSDAEYLKGVYDAVGGESWVGVRVEAGIFKVGCAVCCELAHEKDKDVVAHYGLATAMQLKPYRLITHGNSKVHIDCMLRLLDPTRLRADDVDKATPTIDEMITLLSWMRQGQGIRDGVPSVGAFRKCKKLLFSMAEGLKRLYREWLSGSCTINLLRDERHSRLLLRFRMSNDKAERRIGMFGQPRITKASF
jgi:hypothetical protein